MSYLARPCYFSPLFTPDNVFSRVRAGHSPIQALDVYAICVYTYVICVSHDPLMPSFPGYVRRSWRPRCSTLIGGGISVTSPSTSTCAHPASNENLPPWLTPAFSAAAAMGTGSIFNQTRTVPFCRNYKACWSKRWGWWISFGRCSVASQNASTARLSTAPWHAQKSLRPAT
jgi:hypothetical protein